MKPTPPSTVCNSSASSRSNSPDRSSTPIPHLRESSSKINQREMRSESSPHINPLHLLLLIPAFLLGFYFRTSTPVISNIIPEQPSSQIGSWHCTTHDGLLRAQIIQQGKGFVVVKDKGRGEAKVDVDTRDGTISYHIGVPYWNKCTWVKESDN